MPRIWQEGGLQFGFNIPSDQIKIVVAMHGSTNALNFNDYAWQKYRIGEWLNVQDFKTAQPAVRNPFFPSKAAPQMHYAAQDPDDENSLFQDSSIQALQLRGVQFLCCHTATEEQSRALIKHFALPQQPEEIVKDLLTHTLPGVLIVASMVAAIAFVAKRRPPFLHHCLSFRVTTATPRRIPFNLGRIGV